jgi:ATP-binding cassette, subfamily C (CFTR/MRP), member 1
MRSIKMMGLTPTVFDTVQNARTHELDRSAHFRWFVAFMNLFGTLPKLLSAPFAFALFVFSSEFFSEGGLSAARAFTTLSLLELLTTPLGKVLQSIPHTTAAFGCLDRIQQYLLLDDHRGTAGGESPLCTTTSTSDDLAMKENSTVIDFSGVSLRYGTDGKDIIQDLTLQVQTGSLVAIIGPAGCGKTTLLRAVIGELTPAKGSILVKHKEIAYCQQAAWLRNTTVRKNIIGQEPDNDAWYKTVRAACSLDRDDDLEALPQDEETIGSGGISLSGGQKQRLVCEVPLPHKTGVCTNVILGLGPSYLRPKADCPSGRCHECTRCED